MASASGRRRCPRCRRVIGAVHHHDVSVAWRKGRQQLVQVPLAADPARPRPLLRALRRTEPVQAPPRGEMGRRRRGADRGIRDRGAVLARAGDRARRLPARAPSGLPVARASARAAWCRRARSGSGHRQGPAEPRTWPGDRAARSARMRWSGHRREARRRRVLRGPRLPGARRRARGAVDLGAGADVPGHRDGRRGAVVPRTAGPHPACPPQARSGTLSAVAGRRRRTPPGGGAAHAGGSSAGTPRGRSRCRQYASRGKTGR